MRNHRRPVGNKGLLGLGLALHEIHQELTTNIGAKTFFGNPDIFAILNGGWIPVAGVRQLDVPALTIGNDVDAEMALHLVRTFPEAKFIKANVLLPRLLGSAMPFAGNRRLVTALLHQLRPTVLGGEELAAGIEGPHVVTKHATAIRVHAGHEERPRRRANGRSKTGAKLNALFCDPINVRSLGRALLAVAGEHVRTYIISQNQDNVRFLGRGSTCL